MGNQPKEIYVENPSPINTFLNMDIHLEGTMLVSYKTKDDIAIDKIIVLLGIYQLEFKNFVHTKICIVVFMATLLLIIKTERQPRCLSIHE